MKTQFYALVIMLILSIQINSQWIQQASGTVKGLYTIYFLDGQTGWIAGEDGTILKTTDRGENWFSQSISTLDNIRSIFFTDSLNGWIALYEWSPFRHGSVYHTTNGGNSWFSQLTVFDYGLLSIFFIDNNHGWVVGTNGIIYKTSNGGNNWQYISNFTDGWLYSLRFADMNLGWTAGDMFGNIAKTTNGGNSWIMQNIPTFYYLVDVFCIDQNLAWGVGYNGAIIKTTNGGTNWLTQSSSVTEELRDIQFINETTGWISGIGGVILHSNNGGDSWSQQNSGTSSILYAVAFIDEINGWVVGDNGLILRTINGGVPVELMSFVADKDGGIVQLKWVTATEINNHGFEIERCTQDRAWSTIGFVEGRGTTTETQYYSYTDDLFGINPGKIFYRLKQIDFDGTFEYSDEISVDVSIALSYTLEQNYPNPFNPSTTIRYTLSENSFMKLIIYNSLGEIIEVLEDGFKEAGYYQTQFNAQDLPSGIYLYTLYSNNFILTKKMLLLK